MSELKTTKESLVDVVNRISSLAGDTSSLASAGANAQLNPMVMYEQTLLRLPQNNVNAILQTALSIYCGMYLTAIQMKNTLGKVTVDELLAPFSDNPRMRVSMESFEPSWIRESGSMLDDYGMEALVDTDISKPANLAVGKVLNVKFVQDGKSIDVSVTVRINPRALDKTQMVGVLEAFIGRDNSIIGRWARYNAGEIKDFWDYLFCLDMIADDRKLLINDRDGTYQMNRQKELKAKLSSLVSGQQHLNVASNIIVLSKAGAEELEAAMRGQLANARTRNQFFQTTGAMLLMVVDPAMERIRVYQRGVNDYAVFTFDQIEPTSTNPNAMDLNSIIKAYKMGDSASF